MLIRGSTPPGNTWFHVCCGAATALDTFGTDYTSRCGLNLHLIIGDTMTLFRRQTQTPKRDMLENIENDVSRTRELIHRHALSPRVMEAMAFIPRHEFVPGELADSAYINAPLPIGCGQTISQPFIVALMTDLLRPQPSDVVLEIGTGCGYQTAILASLVKFVYTVELIPGLAASARDRLERLGCDNVVVQCGDGYSGWSERAPFDGIIVTAAAPHIPPPLIQQLKVGAELVIPVGEPQRSQELIVATKGQDGKVQSESVLDVAFVPLRRSASRH